jgi:hypothetical protein
LLVGHLDDAGGQDGIARTGIRAACSNGRVKRPPSRPQAAVVGCTPYSPQFVRGILAMM